MFKIIIRRQQVIYITANNGMILSHTFEILFNPPNKIIPAKIVIIVPTIIARRDTSFPKIGK